RANFTLGGEISQTDAVKAEDRKFSALATAETLINDPQFGQPGHQFQNVFARNVRYFDTSPGGSLYTDFDFGDSPSGVDFQGNGQPWDPGTPPGDLTAIGGSGSQLAAFQTALVPALERASINSTFRFDITPKHRVFGEAKYVRTKT